ncbi:MAG: D-glycerate dehydrogenase [Patescibacteria group bacterium]|nr:D-glycerate dehydrogenase [Patescibacteria group bacterium]MDE2438613.1 D-glycerate dehydrogenase [Patescibacteria group bacterium]
MNVCITHPIPGSGPEILRRQGFHVTVLEQDTPYTKSELLALVQHEQYDAVLSLLTDPIDGEVIGALGAQCKIIANYAVGFDNIDIKEAHKRGIVVTYTPGVLTDAVAGHTIALILALSRRVVEGDIFIRSGEFKGWTSTLLLGEDIKGKTLGVVGLGRIGSEVARRMKAAFDMNILYYDVRRNSDAERLCGARFCELDALLQSADVVSLHTNLTPETRHMIDTERLALMKKTAYLVNTSRGAVIDEAALVVALQGQHIAGAALDVLEHEPTPAAGLLDLHNVVLTPHIASASRHARETMSEMSAHDIIEVLEGRPALHSVK